MERKNFMFKFGFTSFCLTILPISIVIIFLSIPVLVLKENLSFNSILKIVLITISIDIFLLIISIIIGYCVYITDKPLVLQDDGDCLFVNPNDKARKQLIADIKVRKILFIYSLYIVCKPNRTLNSVHIYFNSRKEVIEFIKLYPVLITYIKSDKLKNEIR